MSAWKGVELVYKLGVLLLRPTVAGTTEAIKLNSSINDWKSVLNSYRSHNDELIPMSSSEALQFKTLANQFDR